MKALFSIIVSLFVFTLAKGGNFVQQTQTSDSAMPVDTIIDGKENNVIEEVIETKKAPDKDKVQYISQFTRYGFKNLFNSFGYNPALPYSSQVNPHAEIFMQDYLRNHTNSLIKMKSWGVPYFNLIDNIF